MNAVIERIDGIISTLEGLADDPRIDYKSLVLLFSSLHTLWIVYLYRRQLTCYDRQNPPPELAGHLSKDTFDKAQRYGREKTRFQLVRTVFEQGIYLVLVQYSVYSRLWAWSAGIMDTIGLARNRTITHSLIWFSALTFLSSLPGLPWDYYYTFVIEERHGFNKSTKTLWVMDQVKTWFLLAVLGLPIMAAFLRIIDWAGRSFVPWLMLFIRAVELFEDTNGRIIVQLSLQIIYPTFIQPLFNKLTPLPEGDLRDRVEKLAGNLKFPLKHLYVIDGSKRSSHSNAYFFGTPWSKHIVLYDTLIERSSPAEVEAVLGHELGHWYFSHPTKLLVLVQSNLLVNFLSFAVFIHNRALFAAFDFEPRLAVASPSGGPQPIIIGFTLFQLLLTPLESVFTFVMNAVTRHYEYQADEFSVRMDKKEDLGEALIKLHITNLSSPYSDTLYSMYHHSHPTLPERLRAMDVYQQKLDVRKTSSAKKEL